MDSDTVLGAPYGRRGEKLKAADCFGFLREYATRRSWPVSASPCTCTASAACSVHARVCEASATNRPFYPAYSAAEHAARSLHADGMAAAAAKAFFGRGIERLHTHRGRHVRHDLLGHELRDRGLLLEGRHLAVLEGEL